MASDGLSSEAVRFGNHSEAATEASGSVVRSVKLKLSLDRLAELFARSKAATGTAVFSEAVRGRARCTERVRWYESRRDQRE